jgi:hypothetical protein
MEYFCETCSNTLLNYGHPFYQLFKRILRLHVNGQMMTFNEEEILHLSVKCIINFMEIKDYVITTEISKCEIIVKPNLNKIHFHEKEKCFCFCKSNDHFHKNPILKLKKYPDRKHFLSG